MSRYNENVYYHPETWGLVPIGEVGDPAACYSYDTVAVWRHAETGKLYAAHDAGCSCPTPFEDYDVLSDLVEVHGVQDVKSLIACAYAAHDPSDVQDLLAKVRENLR